MRIMYSYRRLISNHCPSVRWRLLNRRKVDQQKLPICTVNAPVEMRSIWRIHSYLNVPTVRNRDSYVRFLGITHRLFNSLWKRFVCSKELLNMSFLSMLSATQVNWLKLQNETDTHTSSCRAFNRAFDTSHCWDIKNKTSSCVQANSSRP